jgi:hypothetical protein
MGLGERTHSPGRGNALLCGSSKVGEEIEVPEELQGEIA